MKLLEENYIESDWTSIQRSWTNPEILLLLIDDFIGTGETVIGAIDDLFSIGLLKDEYPLKVLTFIAQEAGIENIQKKYPDIVTYSKILNKGLSDNYTGNILKNNINHMIEMERKLNIKPDYQFGYGKSESLVAISRRSANNTFPVFWLEKKSKLAPFKR